MTCCWVSSTSSLPTETDTNFVDLAYNNAPWVTSADALSYESSSEGVCWGSYIQDTWRISDAWVLTGGLRYDRYKNKSIHGSTLPELDDHALTPKLTGTWRITHTDTITASLYQALRTPGLPETYWWAEGQTHGDPVLSGSGWRCTTRCRLMGRPWPTPSG